MDGEPKCRRMGCGAAATHYTERPAAPRPADASPDVVVVKAYWCAGHAPKRARPLGGGKA